MAGHRTVVTTLGIVLFLAASIFFPSYSQQTNRATSRLRLPAPHSVLGFTPGDDRKIADWSQITDYFARLDKLSDRVLVQALGQSTLKRPLIVAFISARENIAALARYKSIQQKLADPRLITTPQERERALMEGKIVVAISCSLHSTEIVASQMSMQLAYELASAQDQTTREILQNTILILIPSPNPDGIDIVANWYRKTLGTPFEGKSPPELYHHYAGHDNNRDWFMLNLKETQLVTHLFWKEWFPEIVYDVHQQGANSSRFFIPPFYDPHNPNIPPLVLRQVGLVGQKMAADLQAAGVKGVITNSTFDTWWHGGFRSAPYYHNSVGILSEAASAQLMSPTKVTTEQLARSTARGMRNALEATTNFPDPWPGGEWRPRDIMKMEMIASRSVLTLASRYRRELLQNFFMLSQQSVNTPIGKDQPLAYLIPAGQGRDEEVAKLIAVLLGQGIEVHRLDSELHAGFGPQVLQRTNSTSEKLGVYRKIIAHTSGFHEVPAGSYIVFTSQPQRANVITLFEPQIYPNRVNAVGEAERPYDVAGWTLSMQMGVDVPAVMEIQESAAARKLSRVKNENEVRKQLGLQVRDGDVSPVRNALRGASRIGLYKSWIPNMDEGWTRFIFDTFNVPYKTLVDSEVRKGALSSSFDVILFPSQRSREMLDGNAAGSYPTEFTGGITTAGLNNLKDFVQNGGTLVCLDAACELFVKQWSLPIRNALEGQKTSDFYSPGSIVALEMERSHPLARGLSPAVDGYFINSSAFETTDQKVRVVARYARENVLRSGWLLGEDKLRGRIALAEVPFGSGRVIAFAFRPQHRGQTWGTLPLLWNALHKNSAP